MKVHRTLALVLALGSASAPLLTAWAKEAVSITISGPGLAGEVQVTDEDVFRALSDTGGADMSASLLPALADEFYVIRIGIGDETGQVFATTVYHYYADPQGSRGYLQYFDVEGGESSAEGNWFRAPAAWDGAFRSVLQSYGVTLDRVPAALPAAQSQPAVLAPAAVPNTPAPVNPLTGLVLAAIVTGVIAGLGLRRTTVSLRPDNTAR
jgi:hypothetical protein